MYENDLKRVEVDTDSFVLFLCAEYFLLVKFKFTISQGICEIDTITMK